MDNGRSGHCGGGMTPGEEGGKVAGGMFARVAEVVAEVVDRFAMRFQLGVGRCG